ncbi:MAG: hypothetical protein IJ501_03020 [Bacilli bacterium]|nr:hypothetical protein [Bacilli bacterium]
MNDLDNLKYLFEFNNLYFNKIINDTSLLESDIEKIKKIVNALKMQGEISDFFIWKLSSLLDYNDLKKKGKTSEEIKRWQREDESYIESVKKEIAEIKEKRDFMFGYPANMLVGSATVSYLKKLETELFFMNNCGSPEEQGNYQMDNKKMEMEIVKLILENLNLTIDDYCGYITTGGTEGNIQGINLGLKKYPNAYLYYSEEAHYSINKCNSNPEKNKVIKTKNGKIDVDLLINEVVNNYQKEKVPAIIFLTFGTTKGGIIDDIELIKKELERREIPNYIHVDAALYGGIPSNQLNAPKLNFKEIDVDSISVSFHKYLGITRSNGILIFKRKKINNYVDYIGQNDTTLSGSRDFNPYSAYQQIKEVFKRSSELEYDENIEYFIQELNNYGINFIQGDAKGNIFLIEKPSDELCKKYQLATFVGTDKEYAHVIIFPFHSKDIIKQLVIDLSKEKNKETNKILIKK